MSLIVNVQRNYIGKFCTKCDTLCYTYEQGLACDCDKPWVTEVIHEEHYPEHWVACKITVEYRRNTDRIRQDYGLPSGEEFNQLILEDERECHETFRETNTTHVDGRSAT